MWIFILIQGLLGCALLVWVSLQNWPNYLLGSLLALPFPALFVWGGLFMRQRERKLKPQRVAYLATNESARRELDKARLIKWVSIAGVALVIAVTAHSLSRDYDGSPALTWIVTGLLIAVIMVPILYSTLVQSKIDEAARRQSMGEPPPTPEFRRKQAFWFITALVLAVGIIAFDRLVDAPISALTVFVYGALIFAAVVFVWRKLRPPRDH